ncbi:MAG: fatty acid cis/trans isomerase, partial [Pseudomonas sp.]|nr:fatty acid cis/trans isomerase [Pseudomonas sp.]
DFYYRLIPVQGVIVHKTHITYPMGRIRKPAANTPAVLSNCTVGSSEGKKAGAK